MHDFVRAGVGGQGDSSRLGSASASHSKGAGIRADGGKESRHGGMVARFSHINMHRLLLQDMRCMLSGFSSKLIDMQKVLFNSFVDCFGSDAKQSTNQRQQDNTYDDDDWQVTDCVGGQREVGHGGDLTRHGMNDNGN